MSMKMKNQAPYLAYVLRLWRNGDTTPWRADLECARTGERHTFANISALFEFLESETGESPPIPAENNDYKGKNQTGNGERVKRR